MLPSVGLAQSMLVAAVLILGIGQASVAPAAEPLHARIDQLIDAAAIGPVAAQSSDEEFVRRVYLDLTGVIPTADEAREFLNDSAADKRAKLIDKLLASPRFARHMALIFDVYLQERRDVSAGKLAVEWQEYLYQSFLANKPYDALVRELLMADGATPENAAPARFYLSRQCEPNLVTRDVGRMFFGMDLQCAQCHDHPLIDDYAQDYYYGIQAFVIRSSLFSDPKTKAVSLAEKADGETNFKSVFTGNARDKVMPQLPGDEATPDPMLAEKEMYVVAPAKGVRPIPKFSRRQELARLATDGTNEQFNRNAANRIWALLLGRGLVQPLDFHHSDNPPTHPDLLTLLAAEFRGMKYDVRQLLREIALTRTYQRSFVPPKPESFERSKLAARLKELNATVAKADQAVEKSKVSAAAAQKKSAEAQKALTERGAELAKLEGELKTAQDALKAALAKVEPIKARLVSREEGAKLLDATITQARAAKAKLGNDPAVAKAEQDLETRRRELTAEINKLKAETQPAEVQRVAQLEKSLNDARARLIPFEQRAAELRRLYEQAHDVAVGARTVARAAHEQLDLAKELEAYDRLAASDKKQGARAWDALIDRATNRFQIAQLKPLSAEQFAMSLMQATGYLQANEQANRTALQAKPPEQLAKCAEDEKPARLATLTEQKTYEVAKSGVAAFVSLYGSLPGSEFAATLDQALFLGNGTALEGWIKSAPGRLSERLTKTTDTDALADDLYLSVLTRHATADERRAVADFLQPRTKDRAVAVEEMIWALVSSNEFRFNH